MARLFKKTGKKVGLPPGTLEYHDEKKVEHVTMSHIEYDMDGVEKRTIENINECLPSIEKPSVSWININGLHDINIIEQLGKQINLHPLVLEDIINTHHRPKIEEFPNHIFCVLKMVSYDDSSNELIIEQFSLVFGSNYILTFQERPGDVFDPVRKRLENANGRLRKSKSDYLAYALIDCIVDHYFVVLEKLGERIEYLEDELVSNPSTEQLQAIYHLKRELIFLRKSIWPLRDILSFMDRLETDLIQSSTHIYLRDLYDHIVQVIDAVETYRDMTSGILDTYLSSISNKMNDVMKVLTIFAAIFIPLTFIAGIYGMNFENIPELKYKWGYFCVWGVIFIISGLMIAFFKKKKWI